MGSCCCPWESLRSTAFGKAWFFTIRIKGFPGRGIGVQCMSCIDVSRRCCFYGEQGMPPEYRAKRLDRHDEYRRNRGEQT